MECDIQGSRKMPKRKSSFSCLDDDDMGGCSIGIVDKGRLIGVVGGKGVEGWEYMLGEGELYIFFNLS